MFSVHLLSEHCALPPMGNAPLPLWSWMSHQLMMNRFYTCPRTEKQEKRCVQAEWQSVKSGITIRSHSLNTVSGIATDCSDTKAERATKLCNNAHKGKRGTDHSDLSLNRWLDDTAIQQGVNRVSCQVTVVVVVTDIGVSSTLRNIAISWRGLWGSSWQVACAWP